MGLTKTRFSVGWITVVLLAVLVMVGCGTAIKYSYDEKARFPEFKSYQWINAYGIYRQDPLLETNVRFLTDQNLAAMGMTQKPEKADLLISMGYEFDYGGYSYQLRMLTLNISRADTNELVWRGTATGDIKTDAASGDLKKAVAMIMANFPPK
jgi:hypothetical protein